MRRKTDDGKPNPKVRMNRPRAALTEALLEKEEAWRTRAELFGRAKANKASSHRALRTLQEADWLDTSLDPKRGSTVYRLRPEAVTVASRNLNRYRENRTGWFGEVIETAAEVAVLGVLLRLFD